MKIIQHDSQSLRHAAIQRYLDTRDRLDQRSRKRTLLLVLATGAILGTAFLIHCYTS